MRFLLKTFKNCGKRFIETDSNSIIGDGNGKCHNVFSSTVFTYMVQWPREGKVEVLARSMLQTSLYFPEILQ